MNHKLQTQHWHVDTDNNLIKWKRLNVNACISVWIRLQSKVSVLYRLLSIFVFDEGEFCCYEVNHCFSLYFIWLGACLGILSSVPSCRLLLRWVYHKLMLISFCLSSLIRCLLVLLELTIVLLLIGDAFFIWVWQGCYILCLSVKCGDILFLPIFRPI